MSINSAMLAGVSGLISNSSALAAISDNIANVNTTAYKRNQVNFANVVTAQAVKGRYSAGGVQAVTRQFVGQQGLHFFLLLLLQCFHLCVLLLLTQTCILPDGLHFCFFWRIFPLRRQHRLSKAG